MTGDRADVLGLPAEAVLRRAPGGLRGCASSIHCDRHERLHDDDNGPLLVARQPPCRSFERLASCNAPKERPT
jgi:hypothetical protein